MPHKNKNIVNRFLSYTILRLLFILCFFVIFYHFSYSQNQKQLIKNGDQLFALNDFYGASIQYKSAMQIDSSYVDLLYKYAESLRLYNHYSLAERYYYSIYRKDRGKTYPLAPFWHATMLKYNGKYQEAKKYFKRSKRSFSRDRKGYHYQKVMQEIKSCQAALIIMRDSLPLEIKNMGNSINTYSSELGATFLNDSTIIYSSLRDEKMKENNIITDTSLYLVRLFQGSKNGDSWKSDKKLEKKINEANYHIANGCLNPKQQIFYYNKCARNLNCNIYAIQYENGEWKSPYEVENVNVEGYTTSQPFSTIIDGTEVLFFSSNRPGGKGMKDIWFTRKGRNGKFRTPANMGSNINTIEDEISPFYNLKDTSIYFSSNWHEGLGGFDIFKAKTDLVTFSKPENLGYPINSSTNDFYYSIRGNNILLTSNRIGSFTKKGETCCNDIYTYTIPDTIKEIYTTLEKLNKYLPVKLYFHNDSPNPRSNDTTTSLNYITTYTNYVKRLPTYKKEYSKGLKGDDKEDAVLDIEDFFEEKVNRGASDLALFTPLLIKELEKGKTINITVKGYASPLSNKEYNVKLTGRRVSSLINYLKEYSDGKILPYINETAQNGGKLVFEKVTYGEYQADQSVSDNINDKKNSVYSRGAALARKIEIIAISADDTTNTALDGSQLEKLPVLTFRDDIIKMNTEITEKKIKVINSGEAPLEIFAATCNCEAYSIILPENKIGVLETAYITIKYNSRNAQQKECFIEFLTNTVPNQIKKKVVLE